MANPSLDRHPQLDDWLGIGADGRVRVRSGKVDIGQRISTALSLIVADELDVAPERIDMVRAETGVAPDEGITSGSNSMEESGHALRLAAATAGTTCWRARPLRWRSSRIRSTLPTA